MHWGHYVCVCVQLNTCTAVTTCVSVFGWALALQSLRVCLCSVEHLHCSHSVCVCSAEHLHCSHSMCVCVQLSTCTAAHSVCVCVQLSTCTAVTPCVSVFIWALALQSLRVCLCSVQHSNCHCIICRVAEWLSARQDTGLHNFMRCWIRKSTDNLAVYCRKENFEIGRTLKKRLQIWSWLGRPRQPAHMPKALNSYGFNLYT